MRLPKIKFDYEKKVKDKPAKLKKEHSVSLRKARFIAFAIVILLLIYFSYVLILSNAIAVKNRSLRENVSTLTKQLDEASAGTTSYNPIVGQYLTDFVTEYYTVNNDNKADRDSKLKTYFAKDLMYNSTTDSNENLTLKHPKLNGIFTVDGVKTAQFDLLVTDDGQDKELTVNVPYQQKNEKMTVIGLPYIAEPIDSVGQIGKSRYSKNTKPLNDTSTVKRVRKFTTQFVNKYLSSSEKEMSLFMADPEGLNGSAELDSLDDSDIKVSGSADKPKVDIKFSVKVKNSGIVQQQFIHLELKKQENTYFVTKFVQA